MGVVMVHDSRKVVMSCADMHGGCSVGHYGLEKTKSPSGIKRGISPVRDDNTWVGVKF